MDTKTEIEILVEIADVGKEMRNNQKLYFRNRTANFLHKSKELEAKFDSLIIQLQLKQETLNTQKQQSLF
jgi:hypothetical protein